MSSSQEEGLLRMTKLVNHLMSRPDASPFCEPVAWRELELWDYPKIVSKMMDLGTIKRKLERSVYSTAHECAQDIRLVWSNCQLYNSDGSDFWLLAKSFSRRFEDKYRKLKAECKWSISFFSEYLRPLFKQCLFLCFTNLRTLLFHYTFIVDVGEPDPRTAELATASSPSSLRAETPEPEAPPPTSLDTKAALSERLFLLSGVELGHVITLIEQQAPQALEDVVGSNQVEIVMDALPPRTFAELDKYTRDKVGHRNVIDASHASGPPLKKSKKSK
jgi:hypothetical protein